MKCLTLLLLSFLLVSCGEPNLDDPEIQAKIDQAIDSEQLQEHDDGLFYELNQEEPYTGWGKLTSYRNGQLIILWLKHYQAGQLHGLWTNWYDNGQKKMEEYWQAGQKHGRWTWWNKDGQKKMEEHWQVGQRHGHFI